MRTLLKILIVTVLLLTSNVSAVPAEEPDGRVKITRRSVSEAVGLSWGDGLLSYQGREYPFSFKASGLTREIDPSIAATELSGEVSNLKNLEHFNGSYKLVEAAKSLGGEQVTLKNQNGVILTVVSSTEGRKFSLGAEGMIIELKK